jgi:hypothetical protein
VCFEILSLAQPVSLKPEALFDKAELTRLTVENRACMGAKLYLFGVYFGIDGM